MKELMVSPSGVPGSARRLSSPHLLELAARLFTFKADRWRRRAQFYERHRESFPRMAASQFVRQCRQLEATYRALVELLFNAPLRHQLVPVRTIALRKKRGGRMALPHHLALPLQ